MWTAIAVLILVGGLLASMIALKRAQNWAAQQKHSASTRQQVAPPEEFPQSANGAAVEIDGFEVSGIHLEKSPSDNLVHAVGIVANRLDRPRHAVQVELDLLDATGGKVGVAMDSIPTLESGSRREFRARVIVPGVAAARLSAVHEQPQSVPGL